MAVAFDAVGPSASGQGGTAGTSITWSHTCSGSNLYVVVGVALGNSPDTATLTVTFGGTSMPSIGLVHSGSGTTGYVQLFGLVNPPAGASTVLVTASATTNALSAGSISFTGVDQTTPIGTPVSSAPASIALSVSVSVTGTTAGNMIVDAACCGSLPGIGSSGQTSRWIRNINDGTRAGNAAGSTAAAGGSVSMSYTTSTSDYWGIIAVEILAAGVGYNPPTGMPSDIAVDPSSDSHLVAIKSPPTIGLGG